MHPAIQQQIMTTRIADMHRLAERDRMVRAARQGRRAPANNVNRSRSSNPVTRLLRAVTRGCPAPPRGGDRECCPCSSSPTS
jgi:hypothetical protein